MNKVVGILAIGTAVLVVIITATLLPEVTVGHEPTQRILISDPVSDILAGRDPTFVEHGGEPITYPIPWLVVSVLALAVGAWRLGWFVRWLERHDREERAGPDDTSD